MTASRRLQVAGGFALALTAIIPRALSKQPDSSARRNPESPASSALISSEGARLEWARSYDGPAQEDDFATALAIDDSGYVFVSGLSFGAGGGFTTIKYGSDGDTQWVRTHESITGSGQGLVQALDKLGHVYVAGGKVDFETVKYDSNGDTAWVRFFHEPLDLYDQVTDLVVDSEGYAFLTGEGTNAINGSRDFVTIKYAPDGDTLWVRRYTRDSTSVEYGPSIAVDRDGFVYVCGVAVGPTVDNALTIKYSPVGDTVWTRRYGSSYTVPAALAPDTAGNLIVAGLSGSDFVTIKYTAAGDTAWVRRYDGPTSQGDRATAVAVAPSGALYVTGLSPGTTEFDDDWAIIKYTTDGDTLWVRRIDNIDSEDDYPPSGIAVDPLDEVYVTGASPSSDALTVKYSGTGELLWQRSYKAAPSSHNFGLALGVDAQGGLYVTGASDSLGLPYDFTTLKYAPCAIAMTGDLNESGTIGTSDIITLVNFALKGGADPEPCTGAADVDCSNSITLADIINIVNFVFKAGSLPCNACDGPMALLCATR